MIDLPPLATPRELWLTPSVVSFLQKGGDAQSAKQLTQDIVCALDGRDAKDGFIRLTACTFLLYIMDADRPEGYERVVVWHGPSDGGVSFNDAILQKAAPCGVDFV